MTERTTYRAIPQPCPVCGQPCPTTVTFGFTATTGYALCPEHGTRAIGGLDAILYAVETTHAQD